MKKTLLLLTLFIAVFSLNACEDDSVNLKKESDVHTSYFDSMIAINLYVDENTDEAIIDEIFDESETLLKNIHQQADRYNTYSGVTNVMTLNEDPTSTHIVEDELFELLMLSKDYHALTNGYFDITMGPVLDIWNDHLESCNENGDCSVPSDATLNAAGEYVGIDKLTLNEDTNEVTMQENMNLNLGGVAKGYATNKLSALLENYEEIESFLINAGTSNIEVYGDHPTRDSNLWHIGVTDPTNPNDPYGFAGVKLDSGTSLVTSGDYVRYFEVDGERYHHLINPNTLKPSFHHRSVTVVIEDGSIGDILSTAAFLMEPTESQAFIEDLDDVEAVWYLNDDSVETSSGFDDYLLEWRD